MNEKTAQSCVCVTFHGRCCLCYEDTYRAQLNDGGREPANRASKLLEEGESERPFNRTKEISYSDGVYRHQVGFKWKLRRLESGPRRLHLAPPVFSILMTSSRSITDSHTHQAAVNTKKNKPIQYFVHACRHDQFCTMTRTQTLYARH